MKILELSAHNVGGIKDICWDLSGHHLWLVGGPNGAGKTSAIRALLLALCGRSGADIPDPTLRIGEKSGWIRVKLSGDASVHDLNGLQVEMEFERKRDKVDESFRVVDSCGDEAGGPRKLLQDLYATRALDPSEFDRMDKKKRRECLMKLVGIDLEAFKVQRKEIYDERKVVNAEGHKLRARFDAMPFYKDAPEQPVEVGKLMDELDAVRAKNKGIADADDALKQASKGVVDAEKEVADLEAKLAEAKVKLITARMAREAADMLVAELGAPIDETPITTQIKTAGEINAQVQANENRKAVESELLEARKKAEQLNEQLKALDESQDKALQTANWPVPGLSVDDEGVIYDGKPYEIINQAKRIYLSASIAIALNPTLRLMVIKDGSDLDQDTLAELEKLLKANDFQAIVEVVTRTQQDEQLCAVVVRDGESS